MTLSRDFTVILTYSSHNQIIRQASTEDGSAISGDQDRIFETRPGISGDQDRILETRPGISVEQERQASQS